MVMFQLFPKLHLSKGTERNFSNISRRFFRSGILSLNFRRRKKCGVRLIVANPPLTHSPSFCGRLGVFHITIFSNQLLLGMIDHCYRESCEIALISFFDPKRPIVVCCSEQEIGLWQYLRHLKSGNIDILSFLTLAFFSIFLPGR